MNKKRFVIQCVLAGGLYAISVTVLIAMFYILDKGLPFELLEVELFYGSIIGILISILIIHHAGKNYEEDVK
jgi:hypothetical protein